MIFPCKRDAICYNYKVKYQIQSRLKEQLWKNTELLGI